MDLDHGNGSSKYSRTDIEESDLSGSSKHSGRHLGLVVRSQNSRHSSRHQELDDDEAGSSEHSSEDNGSSKNLRRYIQLDVETGCSKHSDTYPEIIKGWKNNNGFEIYPHGSGSGSSKRSEVILEEIDRIEGDKFISIEKLSLSSSSSSSGSSTDTQQSVKDKHHVSGNNSSKLEECENRPASPTLTSLVSSVRHESTLIESPPVQMMDRVGEFDPYRIPSAVFARSKSTTPLDWSIASNESLFSIQVENNSFSRDHIVSLKSGELFKSGEFVELSPSPVAPVVDTDKKSIELDKSEATLVSDDVVKDKIGPSAEEPIGEKPTNPVVSWNSSTISNHSIDSVTSAHSFAFPIRNKKKKCAWPSCYCSNCSCSFCYCKWPSCCCSNCSWAFCYSWNCSIKRCCHFCTVLSDGRNVSTKEKAEQQQQQQQEHPLASAVPSKSARCNCCSWFPSCRRHCQWHWHWHWCCCCNCCRGNCC